MQSQTYLVVLVLLLMFSSDTSVQHVRYVNPNDPVQDCPGQPCHTLEQYSQQAKTYFTTGTTFIFLAGNHTLHTTVSLINLSTITLRGIDNDSSITLRCRNIIILCENVNNLTIKGLRFELHSGNVHKRFSAMGLYNSTGIMISNSTFQGSGKLIETGGTRAVYSQDSIIRVISCLFDGNTGDNGGAIHANGSNITLIGNIFTRNKANGSGGAIYAYNSSISLSSEFMYINNHSGEATAGELHSIKYNLSNSKSTFENHITMPGVALYTYNEAYGNGGAIYLSDSNASLTGTVIAFINNSAKYGGGIYSEQHGISTAYNIIVTNTEHLYFIGNNVNYYDGGTIYINGGTLTLGETMKNHHYFINNSLTALYCKTSRVRIKGNSFFMTNGHHSTWKYAELGGAINIYEGILSIAGNARFHYNQATRGGAISMTYSNAVLNGTIIEFKDNTAKIEGGGIYTSASNLTVKAEHLNFIGNTAQKRGGAVAIFSSQQVEISGNFINNTGKECGGAVSVVRKHIIFTDITAMGNSECAFCIYNSKATFTGYTRITSNTGRFGGGINSRNSILLFTHNIEIKYNNALLGGAMYLLHGEVIFQSVLTGDSDIALFTHNTADRDGGALYATGTGITLRRPVHFVSNSAENGGAMYFKTAATLTLETKFGAVLRTSHNHASEYGGVLYNQDAAAYIQCVSEISSHDKMKVEELPYCLLHLDFSDTPNAQGLILITSYLNSASRGEFIYGGLLDRCRMDIITFFPLMYSSTAFRYLKTRSRYNNLTKGMTSPPYKLCFCESNQVHDCSGQKSLSIQRGQLTRISLIALDQTATAVSTLVTAITSPTARLELNQSPQLLSQNCSNLTYNLYSTENQEQLILYPDGPCHNTGLARAVINMTILPCPHAFTRSTSGEQCVCEERLQVYGAECMINDSIYITRKTGSNFWMNIQVKNERYQGLVLCKTCPVDYCTHKTINLTLDSPNNQCAYNRSGVLCGECSANYSRLLGSSMCQICSNTCSFLLLLLE